MIQPPKCPQVSKCPVRPKGLYPSFPNSLRTLGTDGTGRTDGTVGTDELRKPPEAQNDG